MADPLPFADFSRMLTGYWISQMLYVAAKLGLADLLAAGPRPVADLAHDARVPPAPLFRLLRALASVGVFVETDDRRFGLTSLAECLRSDVPGSQRSLAIMTGEQQFVAWGDLFYSVRTGRPAFDKVFGAPIFEHLSRHPDQARIFDEAMVGVHGRETIPMLDAYDFAGVRTLADIGGGNGSLLTAVLRHHPNMRGILFDLPGVIERARDNLAAAGVADRCQTAVGSFFDSVPPGADAYLLRHIIHDWDDETSAKILANVRRVIPERGRLLVIEGVVPPGNGPSFTKLLDVAMLVLPGGRERTEPEFRDLFQASGFRLTRIIPTPAEVSILEATPV